MDPAEECDIGGRPGITQEALATREGLVFAWSRALAIQVAFVLAGDYVGSRLDQAGFVELHRLTLSAATSMS